MEFKKNITIVIFSFIYCHSFSQHTYFKYLADTTYICEGDSSLLTIPKEKSHPSANYYWQTPTGITINTRKIYAKQPGQYMLKSINNKEVVMDTTYLKLIFKSKYFIKDTFFCGSPLIIINKNQHQNYLWSNGETKDRIRVEKAGMYWVKTYNKGCSFIDTFQIKPSNHNIANFGKEMFYCETEENKILSVKLFPDIKLKWNTGETSSIIHPSKEGIYWVNSASKQCGSKTDSVKVKFKDCECDIFIPDSFTPNDDNKNDLFYPLFECEYSYYLMTITDRWGYTVYTSNNMNQKWDGNFKGNPCPDDIYIYSIEAIEKNTTKKITRKGRISLFR